MPVRPRARARRLAPLPLIAGAALSLAGAPPASAQAPEVVASGLANPRGMAFGPNGRLYVTQAGRGGSGRCLTSPEGGEACYGATGRISRINVTNGRKTTIVGSLPSLAVQTGDEPGANATGPHDISFDQDGTAYFVTGLGAAPTARRQLGPVGRRFARLYRTSRGRVRVVADLGRFEASRYPDPDRPGAIADTNPWGVLAAPGAQILVTDAGGNDVLRVTENGRIKIRAVLPGGTAPAPPELGLPPGATIPYQSVPTGITGGPLGRVYVGELTGFPFPEGAANVFRLAGGSLRVARTGFTTIIDVATGSDNTLYVLQIASSTLAGPPTPGRLLRVDADGTQTELAAGQLTAPTGLAVAPDGEAVYVADRGTSPTEGRVVRIATG